MLNEDYIEDGYWWFPSEPDNKYPGELKYIVDEGISLSISEIGSYPVPKRLHDDIPMIYGLTSSGKVITLVECIDSGSSWSSFGISKRKLNPKTAYIGCHISIDDQVFRSCYFHLSLGSQWLKNSGIKIDHKDSFSDIDIMYRDPPKIVVQVNEEFKLVITRRLSSIPMEWFDIDEVTLKEMVWFEIRPNSPMPLEFFIKNSSIFRDFITIACNSMCKLTGISVECNFLRESQKDKEIYQVAEVITNQPSYKNEKENVNSRDFLFSYPDVKDNFENIVNHWYAAQERLRVIKDLYISSMYSPFSYIETRFLSLSQACEVFHRRFFVGKYLDDEVFNEKVKIPLIASIETNLEKGYKESLKQRIAYFNEYSLSRRLKDLSREYDSILSECFGDTKSISRNVVNARNQLTHYSEPEQQPDFFTNVLKYTDYLKLVLDISFLKVLGFDNEIVLSLLKRNHTYLNRLNYIDD